MARIAGVDIPSEKQVQFSLPYIYGIGRKAGKCYFEDTEPEEGTLAGADPCPDGWERDSYHFARNIENACPSAALMTVRSNGREKSGLR